MKKTTVALGAILAVMGPLAASAQEVTLRLSHWVPPTIAPASKGINPWAEAVMEASEGRIKIDIFPAQQLGKAPDHYDMAVQGIVDLSYVNPGYTAGRFPIYALTEIPFMADDSVAASKAIHEWYLANGAEAEMSDVKICFVHPHAPGALHTQENVTSPADLKGKNIRPAHATMARFVSLLGGGPVQVPAPEVREALSKGTAEGVTFPWGAQYDFKLTEEVPVHLDMPFYLSSQLLVMNKGSYDRLSDANKAVIDDHCNLDWSGKVSQGWADDDMAARERLMADDAQTFNTPTEAEVAAWREASMPLFDEWKAAVTAKGGDADAILDAYKAALDKFDAAY
ncbi:TRAP transporter substrate-binding protein [Tropicibacter naphthalenivorans]|uniref:Extracytoplasmic solute receptor protein YiaO n=1 Tax=Tropicibacter naphthalenivorans TaxID=441103 RepID=A0A0P1GHC2_9RHOB|nr:TRAP transporter substrate-binding protein [Tropicibacter naphthalenivorans]CUH80746.1 Extracytoplasmic solute receptor protein YiaO [Tropicibacter naphthalenivorans]SMC89931.1 TRAP-type C4-dicarboxylate transport system, substrate-binding protein [Tropicibacter naphthalenivorans]